MANFKAAPGAEEGKTTGLANSSGGNKLDAYMGAFTDGADTGVMAAGPPPESLLTSENPMVIGGTVLGLVVLVAALYAVLRRESILRNRATTGRASIEDARAELAELPKPWRE